MLGDQRWRSRKAADVAERRTPILLGNDTTSTDSSGRLRWRDTLLPQRLQVEFEAEEQFKYAAFHIPGLRFLQVQVLGSRALHGKTYENLQVKDRRRRIPSLTQHAD